MTDKPKFECFVNQRDEFTEILKGSYDISRLEFDKPPVVLDIGANAGAFSVWAASRWPGAIIHAYEPHPKTARILRRNVSHLPNVTVHEVAVGTGKDHVWLYDGAYNTGCTSLYDLGEQNLTSSHRVRGMSSTDLPQADIVKVDTEGHEIPILSHYVGLSLCRGVMFEWHRHADKWALAHLLSTLRFHCVSDACRRKDLGVMHWRRDAEPLPAYMAHDRFYAQLEHLRECAPQLAVTQ